MASVSGCGAPCNGGRAKTPEYPSAQDVYQAAIVARACGFSVFPVGFNKKPLQGASWRRWQVRRPSDRELARTFVGNSHIGGLAVLTGAVSGITARKDGRCVAVLAVRDFDTADAYRRWASRHADVAAMLPTVRTYRGFHTYARLWTDSLNQLPEDARRGDGGAYFKFPDGSGGYDGELLAYSGRYAVHPPSRHPAGVAYEWVRNQPVGSPGIPVLALAATHWMDGYDSRTRGTSARSRAVTPATTTPARGVSPAGTRTGRNHPEKTRHGFCSTEPPLPPEGGLPLPVREAVLRTQPTRPGHRNDKLLSLARALKDIAPGVPASYWSAVVREWHRLASPVIATKDFAESWCDFQNAWSRAEKPMSASRPLTALAAGVASAEGRDDCARLLAGCRALAAEAGQPFKLAVRTAAAALGVSTGTAHALLAALVSGGLLRVVRKGEPSPTLRMASVYRLGASPGESIMEVEG